MSICNLTLTYTYRHERTVFIEFIINYKIKLHISQYTYLTKVHLSDGFPSWKYISQRMELVSHTIEPSLIKAVAPYLQFHTGFVFVHFINKYCKRFISILLWKQHRLQSIETLLAKRINISLAPINYEYNNGSSKFQLYLI